MFKVLAIVLGGSVLLLAAGLAYRLWDHGRIRVHSTEQAVEMAKKEAGPLVASLPFRVEQDQDIWIIRFGPDAQGKLHNYLVTLWDKRAGPVTESVVTVSLDRPD